MTATRMLIPLAQSHVSHQYSDIKEPLSVVSVTFLVAVNQTETKCLMTSKTPPLRPGVLHNQTEYIHVGKCDYGALDFNITTSSKEFVEQLLLSLACTIGIVS